jgi:hypothetical protein
VLLTASIHLVAYIFLFRSMNISAFGTVTLLPVLTSFLVCVPFDYVSFAKTRFVVQAAARSDNSYYWALLLLIDIVCSCILALAALVAFVFVFFYFVVRIAELTPAISYDIFRIKKQMDPDGSINWEHTFESVTDIGNLFVNAFAELASLSLSSSTVCLLVLSLVCARLIQRLGVVQEFLDKHTSVQEKPLQIVGVISVIIFSAIFWIYYTISRVV